MSQREMPLLGDIKQDIEEVPHRLIVACKTKQEAIQLCIKYSCLKQNAIAELMGIDRGNFSKILTGSAYLPPNKERLLQEICGNKAIIDWCNWDWNQKAIPIDNSEKIAALEAELNQLRRAS